MRRLLLLAYLAAIAGCDPCEQPVNADLTLNLDLEVGADPAGVILYAATSDAAGRPLTDIQLVLEYIEFPHRELWRGSCDEPEMPPGEYTVTAWIAREYQASPSMPRPDEVQGSAQVQIIETESGRVAANEVFITLAQP